MGAGTVDVDELGLTNSSEFRSGGDTWSRSFPGVVGFLVGDGVVLDAGSYTLGTSYASKFSSSNLGKRGGV